VAHRLLHVTHVAREPLPLDHPRRVGTRADRTRRAVNPRRAVRRPAAAEAVALDHALEAAALGGSGHLHAGTHLEQIDGDLVAHVRGRLPLAETELAQHLRRGREPGTRGVALLGLRRPLALLLSEPELDGLVALLLAGPDLDHG